MFAGGRETVIHSLACAIGHLAACPDALAALRTDPDRIVLASEEFFRVFMPLTHIGRVCPTVMRSLLAVLCRRVERITVVASRPRVERTTAYERPLGYESLIVRLQPTAQA